MGTSSSNPGPSNKSPLLPPSVDPTEQSAPPARFGPFRTALGNWAKTGNRNSLGRALSSYVRKGYGGSANVAKRLDSVSSAGARLHSLLGDIVGDGDVSQALGQNISDLNGIDAGEFIDLVVDAVCPDFGTVEDELLRQGLDQAFSNCLLEETFTPESLTEDMIYQLYSEFISEEISNRIINDSKFALNQADNPVQRENELREYVNASVDVIVGPKFDTGLMRLSSSAFEALITETITEIFDDFASF